MVSIALLLATDTGSRWVRTGYRVASVLLVEWIFHFLCPGSCWCWVLYENGKKKRLFDFASWLIFVSMLNVVYPKLLVSAQKVEAAWADFEYGRNVLCLSKIFGLRIIWQVIGGLMVGLGMRGMHQLHHYVRSDIQLLVGHVAALAFLVATFFQGDVVVTGEVDNLPPKEISSDADSNDDSEPDTDMMRPRPFGQRRLFGSSLHRNRLIPPSPYRHMMSNTLQKPIGSRRDGRPPSPSMRPTGVNLPAPRKRPCNTLKGKANAKPRKRNPSGVNNLNGSLVKQSSSRFGDPWSFWSRSCAAMQKHQHHHDHQFWSQQQDKVKGACRKNQFNDGGVNDDDNDDTTDEDNTWSNRSSCNNHWKHCAMHAHEPSTPESSRQVFDERLAHRSSRKRPATGYSCTAEYG